MSFMPPGIHTRCWHTVYISTEGDPHTWLGLGNDPAKAVEEAWMRWKDLTKNAATGGEVKQCTG